MWMKNKKIKFLLILTVLSMVGIFGACDKEKKPIQEETTKKPNLTSVEQEGEYSDERDWIYLMKSDFSEISKEEYQDVISTEGVTDGEYYGGVARTKYYYQLDGDYELEQVDHGFAGKTTIFLPLDREKQEHFMRSSEGVKQEDLASGTMPQKEDEIVLYSSNPEVLGETLEMYFCCNDSFGSVDVVYLASDGGSSFVKKDMKIVGILKKPSEQVYFYPAFCEMMGKRSAEFEIKNTLGTVFLTEEDDGKVEISDKVSVEGDSYIKGEKDNPISMFNDIPWGEGHKNEILLSQVNIEFIFPYVDENLSGTECAMSHDYINNKNTELRENEKNKNLEYGYYDILWLGFFMPEGWQCENCLGELADWYVENRSLIGWAMYNSKCEISRTDKEPASYEVMLKINDTLTKSGSMSLAVSQEVFDMMYPYEGSKILAVVVEEEEKEGFLSRMEVLGYREYEVQTYKSKETDGANNETIISANEVSIDSEPDVTDPEYDEETDYQYYLTGINRSCWMQGEYIIEPGEMEYYKGSIYTMEVFNEFHEEQCVLNIVKQGKKTKGEVLRNITIPIEDRAQGIDDSPYIRFWQHRGYLYYMYTLCSGTDEENFYYNGSNCVYRIPLEGKEKSELVMKLDVGTSLTSVKYTCMGDYLYLSMSDSEGINSLYRYQVETGETEILPLEISNTQNYAVKGGNVYYEKSGNIYCYSMESGTESLWMELGEVDEAALRGMYQTMTDIWLFCIDRETGIAYFLVQDYAGTGQVRVDTGETCENGKVPDVLGGRTYMLYQSWNSTKTKAFKR